MFPSFNNYYYWPSDRPDVPDSRVPIKNATEYHGYQTYAEQYAAQAAYGDAAKYFQMAATLRSSQIKAMPQLGDPGHNKAIEVNQMLANYYNALSDWQKGPNVSMNNIPKASSYGLTEKFVNNLELQGKTKFEKATGKHY